MKKIIAVLAMLLLLSCAASALAAPSIGDIITFGSYEQDADSINGKEPIEWMVLTVDTEENSVLVLSRYVLDCVVYNSSTSKTSWKNCSLNKWLSNTFVPEAFSDEELQYILPSTVSGCEQLVYIPSADELKSYLTNCRCAATKYAVKRGVFSSTKDGWRTCSYWLRMDSTSKYGTFVGSLGIIRTDKNKVTAKDNGVRPMLKLSLDYDHDTVGATLEDLKLHEKITIPGFARLEITGCSVTNDLQHGTAGNHNQTYNSGNEAEYIILCVKITNEGTMPLDYASLASVVLSFSSGYQFGGWSYRYDAAGTYLLDQSETTALQPGESGKYCFGVTVPNAVANNTTEPTGITVDLAGRQFTHNMH